MKCPICDIDLMMSERSGVEIDYCPDCRGVWLDRGELDKIIERSNIEVSPRRTEIYSEAPRASYEVSGHDNHSDHDKGGYADPRNGFKKKKREGFLGDLFDFGD